MKYCKKCLSTDLRPNAKFEDGVCIPCKYYDQLKTVNYDIKLQILKDKISHILRNRKKKENSYDCIIGVSAGKDSTRQAHWVRDRLGLNPLLVCAAYPPKQMSHTGAYNMSNLIEMGFDIIIDTPAPQSSSKLMLKAFKEFGNILKATEMSLFSTVPRLAIELGVNLIFWGENAALQVGDSASGGIDEFDGNNLRNLNTLSSGGFDWIDDAVARLELKDHYLYPTVNEFEKSNINILYLGPAWDDWSDENNSIYAALQGLELKPQQERSTGDLLNASMLDEEFISLNFLLRYYKFGFGRATDYTCGQIRSDKLTRDEAIKIVQEYDGVYDENIIQMFCKYVGITIEEFWNITNKWVNQDIFTIREGKPPVRKFTVGVDYDC